MSPRHDSQPKSTLIHRNSLFGALCEGSEKFRWVKVFAQPRIKKTIVLPLTSNDSQFDWHFGTTQDILYRFYSNATYWERSLQSYKYTIATKTIGKHIEQFKVWTITLKHGLWISFPYFDNIFFHLAMKSIDF